MQMGLNDNVEKPMSKSNKMVKRKNWLIIVVMAIVIIGFSIIGILIYVSSQKSSDSSIQSAENIRENTARRALEKNDSKSAIEIYQKSIDSYSNKSKKAEVYIARAGMLYLYCPTDCKDQILADSYKAEEISPSAQSATNIFIMETNYGNTAAVEKYSAIMKSRSNIKSDAGG